MKRKGRHELLSTEGIARWLENAPGVGMADLEHASVAGALALERPAPADATAEIFKQIILGAFPGCRAF